MQQWLKMEDKSACENCFIEAGRADVPLSTHTAMKTRAESAASSASPSTAVGQDRKVSCAVCRAEGLESEINEHLDSGLA